MINTQNTIRTTLPTETFNDQSIKMKPQITKFHISNAFTNSNNQKQPKIIKEDYSIRLKEYMMADQQKNETAHASITYKLDYLFYLLP